MNLLSVTILDTCNVFIAIWHEVVMAHSCTSMPLFGAFSNTNIRQIKITKMIIFVKFKF